MDSGKSISRLTTTVPVTRTLGSDRSSEGQTARPRLICNPVLYRVCEYAADARPSYWCRHGRRICRTLVGRDQRTFHPRWESICSATTPDVSLMSSSSHSGNRQASLFSTTADEAHSNGMGPM